MIDRGDIKGLSTTFNEDEFICLTLSTLGPGVDKKAQIVPGSREEVLS